LSNAAEVLSSGVNEWLALRRRSAVSAMTERPKML
jgi:hypothetical protein